MFDRQRSSKLVSLLGGIGLVVGSFDPMEGSLLILPGSALLALGSYLAHHERRIVAYRIWSFVLVAIGVGSLFLLSAQGGIGGNSGRSIWWALLLVPYPVGWSLDLWGPGVERWLTIAGVVIGGWYIAILGIVARHPRIPGPYGLVPAIVVAALGIATITACVIRLLPNMPSESMESSPPDEARRR